MRTLNQLKEGESGVIRALHAALPSVRRLADMGLVAGAEVEVVDCAPLGDPMILSVKGCRLALRRKDAASVEIV